MRLSSLRCYTQIVEEKLLPKRRMEVFTALAGIESGTAGEIHRAMEASSHGKRVMSHPHVNARLSELRQHKVVAEEMDMRECAVTGRMCLVFEVVDQFPQELEAKPVRLKPAERIKELEMLVADLTRKLAEKVKKEQLSLF